MVNLRNPSHAGKEACKKGIHRGSETIFTACNSSCGKVMFSQTSVILSTGRGGGACATGGMCVVRGHSWQGGACVTVGMNGGACVAGGCAWQGVCLMRGVMCDRRDGHCSGRYASRILLERILV